MTAYLERPGRNESEPVQRLASESALRQARLVAPFGRALLVVLSVLEMYGAGRGLDEQALVVVALLAVTWLLALRFGRAVSPAPLGPAVATAMGGLAGFVLLSMETLWLPPVELSPARALAMTATVVLLVGIWDCVLHHTAAARRRVLVVGTTVAADLVARETAHEAAPLDVVGLVPECAETQPREVDVPVLGDLEGLAEVIEAMHPDVVVVSDGVESESAVDLLLDVPTAGFRVVGFTSFFEHALGRVPVSSLRASWFVSILHLRQHTYSRWSKRAFDLAVALVGLVLSAPVIAVVALLLAPSGAVLYRQTRVGERGRRFTIVKFRTMAVDAEADGAVWSRDADPRVTRIGRILRRSHLDELPQLLNVLRGDMSIVGPRPERPEFVELLEEQVPFWHRRLLVKPGVTGWAQLKGGYASDCEAMADKLSYDLWYLRNRTVLVDIAICAATAIQMLCALVPGGRGGRLAEPVDLEAR